MFMSHISELPRKLSPDKAVNITNEDMLISCIKCCQISKKTDSWYLQ